MGLSRVIIFEGLYIIDLCEDKIVIYADVKKEMERLRISGKFRFCVFFIYNIIGFFLKLCYFNVRFLYRYI